MIVAAALWFLVGIEVLLVADYSFTLSGRLVIDYYYHYYSVEFSKKKTLNAVDYLALVYV